MEDNIKQNILDKIKKEEVKMTPRQFFVMKWLTLSITSIFFLGLAIYVFAYVTFLFIDNGLVYMPVFTNSGLVNFMIEIPWTLVALGLISIFLFSVTSKTFYRIYRKPFLTVFFSILIIIMISHILLVESGAMDYIKQEAYKENIQLVPSKWLQFRDSQTGSIFIGYVVSTTSNSMVIRDRKNNLNEIFFSNSENPIDLNMFSVGQLVNAYGERVNGQIQIKSIEIAH